MSDSLYDEFWQNLDYEIERQAQCSHSSIELRGEEFWSYSRGVCTECGASVSLGTEW